MDIDVLAGLRYEGIVHSTGRTSKRMQTGHMKTESPNRHAYRFEEIAVRIEALISAGSLLPGARLPAERKLVHQFQASRSTVREALRILAQKDLIEIRRGSKGGAFVKAPPDGRSPETVQTPLQFDRLPLNQIAEFREQIESGVTALAVSRVNAEGLRMLNGRLERARLILAGNSGRVDEFIEADKAFHLSVAKIAGNPLLIQALQETLGVKRYFHRFFELTPALMEINYQDLSEIVEAMANRQPQRAASITRVHISRFNGFAV